MSNHVESDLGLQTKSLWIGLLWKKNELLVFWIAVRDAD